MSTTKSEREEEADTTGLDVYLTHKQVQYISTLSASSISRMVQLGTFPPPVFVGARRPRWIKVEIMQWQREMRDAR